MSSPDSSSVSKPLQNPGFPPDVSRNASERSEENSVYFIQVSNYLVTMEGSSRLGTYLLNTKGTKVLSVSLTPATDSASQEKAPLPCPAQK